jgi:hypothetical protein
LTVIDIGFNLDDEFARLIGGVAFKLLATRQHHLTQLITVTEDRDSRGGPPAEYRAQQRPLRATRGF